MFSMFPALNTFDRDLALRRVNGKYFIVREVNVPTRPLAELLDQYLPSGTAIDLLTIDVEGYDYEVLRSNDWQRYRPEYVLVECLESVTLDQAFRDPIAKLLFEQEYDLVAKTRSTVLFRGKA